MFSQTYMTLNETPFVSNQPYGLFTALKTQVKTKQNEMLKCRVKLDRGLLEFVLIACVRSEKPRDFLSYN